MNIDRPQRRSDIRIFSIFLLSLLSGFSCLKFLQLFKYFAKYPDMKINVKKNMKNFKQ